MRCFSILCLPEVTDFVNFLEKPNFPVPREDDDDGDEKERMLISLSVLEKFALPHTEKKMASALCWRRIAR